MRNCAFSVWLGGPALALALAASVASADEPAKTDAPAAAATLKEVEAGDMKLSVPDTWKQQPPSNRLRLAQFAIPAAEGDKVGAELVITPPIGGTRDANIKNIICINDFSSQLFCLQISVMLRTSNI